MADEALYEKIEDYIKGRLSPEKKAAFEQQIKADGELAAEVDLHRTILKATGEKDVIEYEEQLKKLFSGTAINDEAEPPVSDNRANKPGSKWLGGIGIFLLLVVAAWYLLAPDQKGEETASGINTPTTIDAVGPEDDANEAELKEQLPTEEAEIESSSELEKKLPVRKKMPIAKDDSKVSDNTNQYELIAMADYQAPAFSTVRSGQNPAASSDPMDAIKGAFNEGKYQQARQFLTEYTGNKTEAYQYIAGHVYFKLGDYSSASKEFATLAESFEYGYDADWYLLLSLAAQLPDSEVAYDQQYQKIVDEISNHPAKEKAVALNGRLGQ